MKPLFALLFSLIASAAAATFDAWPALYDVSGVASDDVLNIRAEPSADAPIIGTLAHDATNVEIIRDGENGWGLVNTDEGTAGYPSPIWQRHPNQFFGYLPPITECFGTEPFWTLVPDGNDLVVEMFGLDRTVYPGFRMHQPMQRFENIMIGAGTGADRVVGALRHEFCSDGMSDRNYGLSLTLLIGSGDQAEAYYGCCTISGN